MTQKKTTRKTPRRATKPANKCLRCEKLRDLLLCAIRDLREMDAEYGERIYDITSALLQKIK